MAKETSSANPSLPLYEVLEGEFIALHGELPAEYANSTEPATRLRAIWSAIHGLEEKRSALCISGVLIYIRPAWYGDRPLDVVEYSRRNQAFPHETRADRFFPEAQFESYRMLGVYTIEKLCADSTSDLRDFVRRILTDHLGTRVPPWLENVIALQTWKDRCAVRKTKLKDFATQFVSAVIHGFRRKLSRPPGREL